jgi:phosphoglycerate dehydrogenase-like enzyme
MTTRIIFHGENAACFEPGIADLLPKDVEIRVLPDALTSEADRAAFSAADVIVGARFDATAPTPERVSLYHVPGAGYDAIDLDRLPGTAVVCNCFGHEQAIAEYVFAALLDRHVPLADADAKLRQGDWAYTSGSRLRLHDEMAGKTIGLLGFGHIGKAVARRAKAFEMEVVVANRSPVGTSDLVDTSFTLNRLNEFWGAADVIVVSVPFTDETALYEALRDKRIGGAIIDTWYVYPSGKTPNSLPATLPFHQLDNIVMTPHMSGWTIGTVRRRQRTIAENIKSRLTGGHLKNVIRDATLTT